MSPTDQPIPNWERLMTWGATVAIVLTLWYTAMPLEASSRVPNLSDALTASLHITADLQGRPSAPAPEWVTPLTVALSVGEAMMWESTVTCDNQGAFELIGLEPMTYTVSVRGINTLTATEISPALAKGTNAMYVGPLLAGDLNGDERIDIVDFSLFRGRFGSEDDLGDLNNSGFVDILDFSLLRTNFGTWGPTSAR
jgi:hypothetical protein